MTFAPRRTTRRFSCMERALSLRLQGSETFKASTTGWIYIVWWSLLAKVEPPRRLIDRIALVER
jgi:hypothetical protein